MNGITERLINSVEPISALIVYSADNGEYYLESHKIFNGQMGPGQPVSESFVQEIAERVRMKDRGPVPYSGGLMPKNIIYLDQRTNRFEMLWYMSPRKVFIRFDKALKLKSGEMYIPGLIYHCKGDDLNVFAVKRPPSNKAILFRAPLFNTDRNGSVCMGTAKAEYPEFPTYESIMKYWDIMLFGADFSHRLYFPYRTATFYFNFKEPIRMHSAFMTPSHTSLSLSNSLLLKEKTL